MFVGFTNGSKWSQRFVRFGLAVTAVALAATTTLMTGCSASGSAKGAAGGNEASSAKAETETITMVWLPDNSSADLTAAREAFADEIKAATGANVELMTTTDYNVAIEAVSSGKAQMAALGAEGYIQANKKNDGVQAVFCVSDEKGKSDGACYYSRIHVPEADADSYKQSDGSYKLDGLKGKPFSFVSATSTSGFKVPSNVFVKEFDLPSADVLTEKGKFFSDVLFGNSHVGSAVNLLQGDAAGAAFCDTDTDEFLKLVSGELNMPGATYEVKAGAAAPFDKVVGKRCTVIASRPVLNAPVVVNEDTLSKDVIKKIVDHFTSDKVANNSKIFADPKDESVKSIYKKKSPEMRFVAVDDKFYDPIRKLGA